MSSIRLLPDGGVSRGVRAVLGVVIAGLVLGTIGTPAAFAESKPVNTVLPSISGALRESGTVKAARGTWSGGGAISYFYQWQRCESPGSCTNIVTGTEQTYKAVFADVGMKLRVVVTAVNGAGSGEATSAESAAVAGIGPKNETLPTISGSPVEGQLLTLSPGTWAGTPPLTFKYEWERCPPEKSCIPIEGATSLTYRVQEADVSYELRAKVTVTNKISVEKEGKLEEKEEKEVKKTAQTAVVTAGPPSIIGLPSITGDLRQGHTLTAHRGEWHGHPTISYSEHWESCNASHECTTASGSTYALGAGDVGNTIKLSITATNEYGSTTAKSVSTPAVLSTGESFAVGWGEDDKGQLGTLYKTAYETTPVLSEGSQHVAQLSFGSLVSFALHEGGTVTASGSGGEGALGDELRNATWELGKSQVLVEGLEPVSEVSSGGDYVLARQENGDIEAWGSNFTGELGNGTGGFEHETGESQHTPKEVKALHGLGVTSIASGGKANFAVLPGGEVKAWGYNNYGQLSVSWPEECLSAKTCEPSVKKAYEKHEPAAGEHICFTEIGKYGQICSKVPRTVMEVNSESKEVALQHVEQVTAGSNATYALLEGGEVDSWGSDSKGQLAQEMEPTPGSKFIRPARVMVGKGEPLQHVVSIAAGNSFAIAVLESGKVVGWGEDREGQLGEAAGTCKDPHAGGTWACDRYATTIKALEGVHVTAVAAGGAFSLVLGEEGTVRSAGQNNYGQLGVGPKCENEGGELGYGGACWYTHWQTVPGLEHVLAISAGGKVAGAEVSGEGTPPPPTVAAEPGHEHEYEPIAVKLEWAPPAGEKAVRLAGGLWTHPAEEGAELEEGASEEAPGGTAGEPPKNTTLPMIKEYERVGEGYVKVPNDVVVGIYLKATTGNWEEGPTKLKYSYRWLRCKSSKCATLRGWTEHEGELLQIPEQDKQGNSMIGTTIEVEVAAWHEGEVAGIVTSPPTEETVREGNEKNQGAHLEGANGYLFSSLGGVPLESAQYEILLYTEGAPKEQTARDFVVKPE
jgi:alpha-tubulin suppressor-like RCC1 family protein